MPQQAEMRVLELPPTAVDAFEELGESLPDTPQNAALVAAVKRLGGESGAAVTERYLHLVCAHSSCICFTYDAGAVSVAPKDTIS